MGKLDNLARRQFGRLVVLDLAYLKNRTAYWNCKCECGVEKVVRGTFLRNGHSKSCGCLQRDIVSCLGFKHGLFANSGHYARWQQMKARCYCKTHENYHHYGGRGIKVCKEWFNPVTFIEWCKSKEPIPEGYSLDREDNNGNYSPENCRFVSQSIQVKNRRKRCERVLL